MELKDLQNRYKIVKRSIIYTVVNNNNNNNRLDDINYILYII